MPSNDDRAQWAWNGLERFGKDTGQKMKHDLPEIVGDFLADLMHLCNRDGLDFDERLANGRGHYQYELTHTDED